MFGFRKKLGMRRGRKRGRPLRRVPGGSFRIAKAALAGVKKLRRSSEVKFHPVSFGATTVPVVLEALEGLPLSAVAEGTTPNTRIGRVINPTSMFFRFCLTRSGSATTKVEFVRFVIIKDKDSNGVPPKWSPVGGVFDNATVITPMNRSEGSRFRVIYDALMPLNSDRLTAQKKKYIRLSGRTTFQGPLATDSSLEGNQYWLFIATDTSGTLPNFSLNLRINYRDP